MRSSPWRSKRFVRPAIHPVERRPELERAHGPAADVEELLHGAHRGAGRADSLEVAPDHRVPERVGEGVDQEAGDPLERFAPPQLGE